MNKNIIYSATYCESIIMQRHQKVTCEDNAFPSTAESYKLRSIFTLFMLRHMRVRFKHLQLTNSQKRNGKNMDWSRSVVCKYIGVYDQQQANKGKQQQPKWVAWSLLLPLLAVAVKESPTMAITTNMLTTDGTNNATTSNNSFEVVYFMEFATKTPILATVANN